MCDKRVGVIYIEIRNDIIFVMLFKSRVMNKGN